MKKANTLTTVSISIAVISVTVGLLVGMTYLNSDFRTFWRSLLSSVRYTDKDGGVSWPLEHWAQENLAPLEPKSPDVVHPKNSGFSQ